MFFIYGTLWNIPKFLNHPVVCQLSQCGTEWASLGLLPEPFLTSFYLPALLSTGLAHLVPIIYSYNWRSCTDQHWLTGVSHFYPPFVFFSCFWNFERVRVAMFFKRKNFLKITWCILAVLFLSLCTLHFFVGVNNAL